MIRPMISRIYFSILPLTACDCQRMPPCLKIESKRKVFLTVLKLFLLFAVMPMAEIMLILQVSDNIGGLSTFALVIITAILGANLVRQQGINTMQTVQQKLAAGSMPGQEMAEGILLLIAGVLLVTPGFITDGIGFLFVLPFSRPVIAKYLLANISLSSFASANQQSPFTQHTQSSQQTHDSTHGRADDNGDVIEGEYQRHDDRHKLP